MLVKQVSRYVFDVFYGKGWGNWVRVERTFDRKTMKRGIRIVNDCFVPSSVWQEIKGAI